MLEDVVINPHKTLSNDSIIPKLIQDFGENRSKSFLKILKFKTLFLGMGAFLKEGVRAERSCFIFTNFE